MINHVSIFSRDSLSGWSITRYSRRAKVENAVVPRNSAVTHTAVTAVTSAGHTRRVVEYSLPLTHRCTQCTIPIPLAECSLPLSRSMVRATRLSLLTRSVDSRPLSLGRILIAVLQTRSPVSPYRAPHVLPIRCEPTEREEGWRCRRFYMDSYGDLLY